MITRQTLVRWLWVIPVCVAVLFVGQLLGAALVSALGMELPPSPVAVDEGTQILLFFPAAIAVSIALAVMAAGLAGRWWERATLLAAFYFVINGIGNTIETVIFTTLDGQMAMAAMQLPQSLLGATVAALLFAAPSDEGFGKRTAAFLAGWRAGKLVVRLGLAVLAFPLIYFLFGMMVAPIVTPVYAELDFLVTPPISTMLKVVFVRSVLLLLVSLPIIVGWRKSRGMLIVALGIGHFVAVGFAGLVQATFFPAVLRWAHGIEILADSICYAAVLALLFFPRRGRTEAEQPVLQERLA